MSSYTLNTGSESHLKNHKASIHDGVRYKCTQCQKQFTQKFQLKFLISSVHLGKKVQCKCCDYQVWAGSALRAHISAVHKGIRYKCDICGQTFRNKGANKSSKHDKKSLINHSTEDEWECIVLLKSRLLNFNIYDWEY